MKINRIGVITSGGDVPGLNAALHAIVLTAMQRNVEVIGINDGYDGLIEGRFCTLDFQMVKNVMDEGGTILRTSRSKLFLQSKYRKKAFEHLKRADINGLLIIGGNGSLKGAEIFANQFEYPVMGIPKTIDNDIYGTDYALGFDTAVNTIVEAIDKIKDTADSTSRIFIVEVMGRKAGFLALHSGIAIAANAIIIPELKPDIKKLLAGIQHNWRIGNRAMIIVVTENSIPRGGMGLKKIIDSKFPKFESRVTILGHVQRGGSPSAFDRTLATLLAYHGTLALLKGNKGKMVGLVGGKIKFTSLTDAGHKAHVADAELMKIANEFSVLI